MAAAWGGREDIVKHLLKDCQCSVNVRDIVSLTSVVKGSIGINIANQTMSVLVFFVNQCSFCHIVLVPC